MFHLAGGDQRRIWTAGRCDGAHRRGVEI